MHIRRSGLRLVMCSRCIPVSVVDLFAFVLACEGPYRLRTVQKFNENGLFAGKNFVFDERMAVGMHSSCVCNVLCDATMLSSQCRLDASYCIRRSRSSACAHVSLQVIPKPS